MTNIRFDKKTMDKSTGFWRQHRLFVVIVVVAVLVVLYIWWFLSSHHQQVQSTQYTPKPEVLQNRYFAAQALLGNKAQTLQAQQGRQTLKTLWEQESISAKQTTIIIYQTSGWHKTQFEQIMSWVKRGGHLIVANQYSLPSDKTAQDTDYLNKQNPLLVELGIVYQDYDVNHSDKQVTFDDTHIPLQFPNQQSMVVVGQFGRFDTQAFSRQYPDAVLYDYDWFDRTHKPPTFKIPPTNLTTKQQEQMLSAIGQSEHLFHPTSALVDMQIGQGRLTVLSDADMFANPHAGIEISRQKDKTTDKQADIFALLTNAAPSKKHNYYGGIASVNHAALLMHLTHERQQVYLVPDIEATDFLALLWRHLSWTMLGLMLTVVLALLALPKRFGPTKHYQTDTSRNIFGFFAHVGQYLWVSDQAAGVLAANRQALLQIILAKEQSHDMTPEHIVSLVSQKTGLSAGLIYEALYQKWQNQIEFLRISRSFAHVAKHYGI